MAIYPEKWRFDYPFQKLEKLQRDQNDVCKL